MYERDKQGTCTHAATTKQLNNIYGPAVAPQHGYSIKKKTVQPVYSCCCWRRAPRGRTPRASQQAPSHLPGWGGGWHLAHISCERTWAQRRGQQGFIGGRGPPQQTVTRPQSGPAWYLSSNSPKGGSDLPPPPTARRPVHCVLVLLWIWQRPS